MSDTKKYYWLKLKKDFFKRHDTVIIESLPNGKDYLLFYLKLLVESLDHDGRLRFSDTIPYSEEMLSTISGTNIDIVRTAVKVFTELGMMEKMDDGTYFMSRVESMIGYETSDAVRKREYREQVKQIIPPKKQGGQCPDLSQKRAPELELEKEIEIEKEHTQDACAREEPVSQNPIEPKFPRMVYDKWSKFVGVPVLPEYSRWIMSTNYREFAEAVRGYHSDVILGALDNFAKILNEPSKYWIQGRPSLAKFFSGPTFGYCQPGVFPTGALKDPERGAAPDVDPERAKYEAEMERLIAEEKAQDAQRVGA